MSRFEFETGSALHVGHSIQAIHDRLFFCLSFRWILANGQRITKKHITNNFAGGSHRELFACTAAATNVHTLDDASLKKKIAACGLYFFWRKIIIRNCCNQSYGCSFEKGKPAERQGRKVSDLRDKTYDSGAANEEACFWLLLYLPTRRVSCQMPSELLKLIPPIAPLRAACPAVCLSIHLSFQQSRELIGCEVFPATGSELKSLMLRREVRIPGLLNMLECWRLGAGFQPAAIAGFCENLFRGEQWH